MFTFHRALTENSTQLSTSLAQANEAMSAVQSELDKLKEKEKEKEKKLTEYDVQFGYGTIYTILSTLACTLHNYKLIS